MSDTGARLGIDSWKVRRLSFGVPFLVLFAVLRPQPSLALTVCKNAAGDVVITDRRCPPGYSSTFSLAPAKKTAPVPEPPAEVREEEPPPPPTPEPGTAPKAEAATPEEASVEAAPRPIPPPAVVRGESPFVKVEGLPGTARITIATSNPNDVAASGIQACVAFSPVGKPFSVKKKVSLTARQTLVWTPSSFGFPDKQVFEEVRCRFYPPGTIAALVDEWILGQKPTP